jgi:hypothetical protein
VEFFVAYSVRNTFHDEREQGIDQREECPEIELGEQQRAVRIKR